MEVETQSDSRQEPDETRLEGEGPPQRNPGQPPDFTQGRTLGGDLKPWELHSPRLGGHRQREVQGVQGVEGPEGQPVGRLAAVGAAPVVRRDRRFLGWGERVRRQDGGGVVEVDSQTFPSPLPCTAAFFQPPTDTPKK